MRFNIMFGLNHVEESKRVDETRRLLADLSKQLYTEFKELKPGDSIILRDVNGNRVGVADAFKD